VIGSSTIDASTIVTVDWHGSSPGLLMDRVSARGPCGKPSNLKSPNVSLTADDATSGPSNRTVDNFIVKLRKKIERSPDKPEHILTVYGFGYKLAP
jgi:hypothetical protein